MKSTINGLRYDTDKAIKIGSGGNDLICSDFSYWEATLYKTPRSGRYFLAGSGGPMSRYSRAVDSNSRGGGSRIDPMTPDEALAWAEQYLTQTEIDAHFSDMIEDA